MFASKAFFLAASALFAGFATADSSESDHSSSAHGSSSRASSSGSHTSSASAPSGTGAIGGGGLTIITPSQIVECQPVLLKWSGGKAPYYPGVIPGEQPSAAPLIQFNETKDTEYKWTVNIAAGGFVTIQIRDDDGNINYASALTIQKGSDDKCVDESIKAPTAPASSAASAPSAAGTTGSSSTSSTNAAADEGSSASRGAVVLSAAATAFLGFVGLALVL